MSKVFNVLTLAGIVMLVSIICSNDTGDLLLGKPSSTSDCNDNDASTICEMVTKPVPYWQVDLLAYYDIHNVSIKTCWGKWGWETQSAAIDIYYNDPKACPDPVTYRYGMTPADTGEKQTHTFHANSPFSVRYLRVYATVQKVLGLEDVSAFGTIYKIKRDYSMVHFLGISRKQAAHVKSRITTKTVIGCAARCHVMKDCLAFSYKRNTYANCLLSNCHSTIDAPGWTTMAVDVVETLKRNADN